MPWTLQTFQADALAWQNYNFPNTTSAELLLGITEELGELGRALLTGNDVAIRDSVADMAIFAANFANKMNLNIEEALNILLTGSIPHAASTAAAFFQLTQYNGELNHSMLKIKQGIRGQNERILYEAFSRLWYQLEQVANVLGFHFYETLFETWDEVRKRDWRRYPENGIALHDDSILSQSGSSASV